MHGDFSHSVGSDIRQGEDTSTSHSKSQIIDITGFSSLKFEQETGSTLGTPYVCFCGGDYIIDSIVGFLWNGKPTEIIAVPQGTKYIRLRGYADLYASRDYLTLTAS